MSAIEWRFADFTPGHSFGALDIPLDAQRVGLWGEVFADAAAASGAAADVDAAVAAGACGGELSRSVLVAAMMEAYLRLLQPRPPGNIHASQALAFTGRPVRAGTVLTARLECRDKFVKKDRRWVVFRVTLSDGAAAVMTGDIASIWSK